MTRQELIGLCLSYPDVYEDYPFDDLERSPASWTVMRHMSNRKGFAFIFERGGLCVNVKCEPAHVSMLPSLFEAVSPGFHMNKTHWITVRLGLDVEGKTLQALLDESYRLTAPAGRCGKRKTKKNNA